MRDEMTGDWRKQNKEEDEIDMACSMNGGDEECI
jgi:hypothetical protein